MKTILIIDDSEADQFYNEVVLQGACENLKILKAYDGQEGLEVLKNNEATPPDIILLDVNMSGMDGMEFLEHYSEGNTREIPIVIMLTSSDQGKDKDKVMHYKCVKDYLLKPIQGEIVALLEKHAQQATA